MEFPVLESKRLVLREHRTLDDKERERLAKDNLDAMDEDVFKNTTIIEFLSQRDNKEYTIDDARDFLASRKDDELVFGIYNKDNEEFVGTIGVHHINKFNRNAELGFWISRHHRGKGFISEVIDRVMRYCFEDLNLHMLEAQVYAYNIASSKALEKNGFTKSAVRREYAYRNDKFYDAYVYDILASEFKN